MVVRSELELLYAVDGEFESVPDFDEDDLAVGAVRAADDDAGAAKIDVGFGHGVIMATGGTHDSWRGRYRFRGPGRGHRSRRFHRRRTWSRLQRVG